MDLGYAFSMRLRWTAAVPLTVTAGIHIALVPSHLHEAPYAGALFITLSAAALATTFVLLTRSQPVAWLGAALLSVSALLAYTLSRSVGLPSLTDDIGDWLNPLGVVAAVSEAATLALCSYALLHARGRKRDDPSSHEVKPPLATSLQSGVASVPR